jgi:hypothetical protein
MNKMGLRKRMQEKNRRQAIPDLPTSNSSTTNNDIQLLRHFHFWVVSGMAVGEKLTVSPTGAEVGRREGYASSVNALSCVTKVM